MFPDVMAVPLTPMSHTTFMRHVRMSEPFNPTDAGGPTRQRIAKVILFQKKLNCFLIHAQPPQTIEWIDHLKLCVVLHELLFSTQRHRRWICTLQPLSHSVPFAHMTSC